MTSRKEIYVWIWTPGQIHPVVAGKLILEPPHIFFHYGKSYLAKKEAMAIYDEELPLEEGLQQGRLPIEKLPGCIADSSPDAWGRQVIAQRVLGTKAQKAGLDGLDEFTYLVESGSDRIGALDFQESPKQYRPRLTKGRPSLEELLQSVQRVEEGAPLTEELDQALFCGSSIGGARPKVLIDELEGEGRKWIAKFSLQSDLYSVVKAEFVAMTMAHLCQLNVPSTKLQHVAGKDILLVERFDRKRQGREYSRKLVLSALTLMQLDAMTNRYASYQKLAQIIRHRFKDPKETLKEMFSRMVFNVLCGNTDDHGKNHAAFWDGRELSLTPAYDLCPQMRSGNMATQAMAIMGENKNSKLSVCLEVASEFLLSSTMAHSIIENQIQTIEFHWKEVCEQGNLTRKDQDLLKRLFLNPYSFEGYGGKRGT